MSSPTSGGRRRRGSMVATGVVGLLAAGLAVSAPASAATPPPWNGTDPEEAGGLSFFNAAGDPITGGATNTPLAAYIQGDHATRVTNGFTDTKSSLYVYRPNSAQTPDLWSDNQLMGSAATYPNASAPGGLASSPLPLYTSKPSDSTLDDVIATYPNTNAANGYGPNLYEVRIYTAAPQHSRSLNYDWAEISVDPGAQTWSLVYSPATVATTVPGTPSAVSATAGDTSATVRWTAPASTGGSAITGYQVRYSGDGGTSFTEAPLTNGTSLTVTGLINGTSYVFEVAAVNAVGTGAFSSPTAAVVPAAATAPGAPTGVTTTADTNSATVSWTAPATDGGSAITAYQVRYSSDNGATWTSVAPGGAGTSQIITGLANGTSYVFEVAAINPVGEGPWSAASAAVVPKAPTALSISGSSSVRYGSSARLDAKLVDRSTGQSLGGRVVSLYGRTSTSRPFSLVKNVSTSSTGSASALVKLGGKEQFEWKFTGDGDHTASTSSARTVTVVQAVAAHVTATRVRHGSTIKVYGNVAPTSSGARVYLQRYYSKRWHTVASTVIKRQKMPNRQTYVGFDVATRLTAKGTYSFRVVKSATSTLLAGTSGTLTVRST